MVGSGFGWLIYQTNPGPTLLKTKLSSKVWSLKWELFRQDPPAKNLIKMPFKILFKVQDFLKKSIKIFFEMWSKFKDFLYNFDKIEKFLSRSIKIENSKKKNKTKGFPSTRFSYDFSKILMKKTGFLWNLIETTGFPLRFWKRKESNKIFLRFPIN